MIDYPVVRHVLIPDGSPACWTASDDYVQPIRVNAEQRVHRAIWYSKLVKNVPQCERVHAVVRLRMSVCLQPRPKSKVVEVRMHHFSESP